MGLLGRQSQNLCPKSGEPVFYWWLLGFSLSIWAVSFALRVKDYANICCLFTSVELSFHLVMGQKIASFLIFSISFLFFSVAGDLLFSRFFYRGMSERGNVRCIYTWLLKEKIFRQTQHAILLLFLLLNLSEKSVSFQWPPKSTACR